MRRLVLFLIVLAAALGPLVRVARADDDADRVRERVEMLRRLPPEEQERLREALRRFRALPEAERRELRRRAETVGTERLRELVGHDVERLRRRHRALDRERREIVSLLGGEERFAALADVERRYVVSLAVRSFQKHVRRTLLDIAGPNEMEAFSRLPRDERKKKLEAAAAQLEENLLAAETPESRAEILALPPQEQRRRRRALLAEHRLSLVPTFVTAFERQRVRPFLLLPPEERRQAAERWTERARWFEMRSRLENEIGVSRATLRLLSELGPEDCSRVRDEYDRTGSLSAEERRVHLEEEIRRVHGRGAMGETRGGRGRQQLRQMLREERRRRREATAPR